VPKELHKAVGGGLLGQLQVLTNEPNFFTYTAIQPTRVALLNGHSVRRLMAHHPHVALQLAVSVIDQMSPYVRSIDFALEWMLVESGKALYKQDSKADSTYVILSGRLRSVITRQVGGEKKRELVADHGRGELCGIVETLMKTPRSTTVIAVRDTEVAKLPAGLLDFIKLRFPTVLMRLIKLLGQKLQQSWEKGPDPRSLHLPASTNVTAQSNFSTVAIIPLSPNIPIGSFTLELLHALNQVDLAIRVTKDYVLNELGSEALDKSADFRLSSWLTQLEDKHRIVLYQVCCFTCLVELNINSIASAVHASIIGK
jgi:lysophospholipid hydrolase